MSSQLLVLPKQRSSEAYICTLRNPRTSTHCRYFCDPENGIYEFKTVSLPRPSFKSWLLTPGALSHPAAGKSSEEVQNGMVIETPSITMATPIDPLFLIIPALCRSDSAKHDSRHFLCFDDILESLFDQETHFEQMVALETFKTWARTRMEVVCDKVDAGNEQMFRLNLNKLLQDLCKKAKEQATQGLPASMEQRFIQGALDLPFSSTIGQDVTVSTPVESAVTSKADALGADSQSSNVSSSNSVSDASLSTEMTVPDDAIISKDDGLLQLLRIKTALDFMIVSYIPKTVAKTLSQELQSSSSPFDFKPLEERLVQVATLRKKNIEAASSNDYSLKRSAYEEDELSASRTEKKRKKDKDDKKRKMESRGIRDLKKADTSGMKKMSDFFGRKAAAART